MEKLGFNEYQKLAMVTCKKYDEIRQMQADVGLGLAGESGEVADIIKKHLAGIREIDHEHIVEELGDVLWYLAEASECFGTSLEEIATKNIEKLKKRYPHGFDPNSLRER